MVRRPLPRAAALLLVTALVIAAIVALRWPGMDGLYSIDDRPLLTSPVIADPGQLREIFVRNAMFAAGGGPQAVDTYRPLSIATFVLDHQRGGAEPAAYHRTNLLLHSLTMLAALLLVVRLVPTVSPAVLLLCGLWGGLHPAGAEAHVWINGRSDVLMTLFALAGTHALITSRTTRRPAARVAASVLAAGLLLLGCLSKETLVLLLPGILVLVVGSSWDGRSGWASASENANESRRGAGARALAFLVAPAIFAGGAYAWLRFRALGGASAGDGSLVQEALGRVGLVVADGIHTVLYPTRLAMRQLHTDYALVPDAVAWGLTVAAIGGGIAALVAARRRPLVLGALLVLAGTLAPVAILALSPAWPGMNRYPYPAIAFALPAIAAAWTSVAVGTPRAGRLAVGALALLCLVWSVRFREVVHIYRTPAAFAEAVHRENPRALHGWSLLGGELMAVGRWEDAAQVYALASEVSGSDCRIASAHVRALRRAGRRDEARVQWAEAAALCSPPPPPLLEDEAVLWRGIDDRRAVDALIRCLRAGTAAPTACAAIAPSWLKPHELPAEERARLEQFAQESSLLPAPDAPR